MTTPLTLTRFLAARMPLQPPTRRDTCARCRKAASTCYCAHLRPFVSPLPFVILQDSGEARNAIATARMAHLSMTNSELIVDRAFGEHQGVHTLLADETRRHVLLYPSPDATPLEAAFDAETDERPLTFWVIDGKWSQVPKMLRLSPNVKALPKVTFNPEQASRFRIRKQPRRAYLSTIETIHYVISRYVAHKGQPFTAHEALLETFDHLVKQQLTFVAPGVPSRHALHKAARRAKLDPPAHLGGGRPPQPTGNL